MIIKKKEDGIMALITCPECGKEVSSNAYSCPNCGYTMSSPSIPKSIPNTRIPQPTKIGAQQKNMLTGGFGTIGGLILIVLGILALFVILPVGIILVLAGSIILTKGDAAAVGTHSVVCPYCGSSGTIESPATSYRCPACSKKSVKRDGYLHPVL